MNLHPRRNTPVPQNQQTPTATSPAAGVFNSRPFTRPCFPISFRPLPQRQQFPRFYAVVALPFPPIPCYSPSGPHSPLALFPQRQHFPRFSAVVAWPFSLTPYYRLPRPHSPFAPFPQRQHFPRFSAVAAWPFSLPPTTDPLGHILLSPPFHNGSISRISLPLWHGLSHYPPTTDPLGHILLSPPFHNGSIFRDSLPLRHGLSTDPLLQAFREIVPPSKGEFLAAFPFH